MLFVVQTDAHTDTLISEQASLILGHCGLAHLYSVAQQHQPHQVCTVHLLIFACLLFRDFYKVSEIAKLNGHGF